MNDYRTKSDLAQDIPNIMHECRGLMTYHLKNSFPTMMDEVDDVLLDIAIKTTNPQERTKFFNAMHEVRLKRHIIERNCLENFAALFNEKFSSDRSVSDECEGPKDEKAMMISNAVNRVRNECRLALLNLDEHMGDVLNTADNTNVISNPVSPEVVCTAFYNACELVDSGTEIRLIIYKYFEKNVTSMLNAVYSEIDDVIKTGSTINISKSKNQTTPGDSVSCQGYQSIDDIKQIVTSEIEHLVTGNHLPSFVSDFVLNHWVKLLGRIYDKNGTNGDSWQHAIETVEDLVWSVGSIASKQDRERFDKLWPDLIMRLRNGINMISMPPHEQTDFISKLFKHRAALTMLGALSKSKNDSGTLIQPKKIHALKVKLRSGDVSPVAKEMDVESIGAEDNTIPVLETKSHLRPFMDELLVDNNETLEGFKTDITGG